MGATDKPELAKGGFDPASMEHRGIRPTIARKRIAEISDALGISPEVFLSAQGDVAARPSPDDHCQRNVTFDEMIDAVMLIPDHRIRAALITIVSKTK